VEKQVMEKIKNFLKSEWMVKLYRIAGYAVIEILGSKALIVLLQEKVPDEVVYGVVIVVIVKLADALKELLGEKSMVSKML
jgi:hypothetical protein